MNKLLAALVAGAFAIVPATAALAEDKAPAKAEAKMADCKMAETKMAECKKAGSTTAECKKAESTIAGCKKADGAPKKEKKGGC
jgi:hypothetical protein